MTVDRNDGLLTDEIVGRAMSELSALDKDFRHPASSQTQVWLADWEARLDNVLSDLTVVRDRFRKAQT